MANDKPKKGYCAFLTVDCEECKKIGANISSEAGIMLFFNETVYNVDFECEDDVTHDYSKTFRWDDKEGPYYNQFVKYYKEHQRLCSMKLK